MRLAAGLLGIALILAPGPGRLLRADELDTYLASQAKLLEDASIPMSERSGIALEMASASRSSGRSGGDSRRPTRALGEGDRILDDFSRSHPGSPETRTLQAQAAVFAWAIGSSRLHQARLNPTDQTLRQKAVETLDQAVERLQKLRSASDDHDTPLARQIRIRLAQALRDRAELDPDGSPDRDRTADSRPRRAGRR